MKNDDESLIFTCDKDQKAYAIEAGTIALVGSKLKNVLINCSTDKNIIMKKTMWLDALSSNASTSEEAFERIRDVVDLDLIVKVDYVE